MTRCWTTSRGRPGRHRRATWLLGACLAVTSLPAAAQPEEPAASRPDDARKVIDEAVAQALFERGQALFDQGDHGNAKMLLSESLERSTSGPVSRDALALLQQCNAALGIPDPNHGAPPALQDAPAELQAPLDPYAQDGGDEPLDPYGSGDETVDPYDTALDGGAEDALGGALAGDDGASEPSEPSEEDLDRGRRTLMLYGAAYGATVGLTLAGGEGDASLAAALAGAGAGLGGSYLLARSRPLTAGKAATIAASGVWVGTAFGLLSDLVTGIDSSSPAEVLWGVTLGGLAGTGAGWLVARKSDPSSGDVALVNSLGLYGTASALLIGVGLDPLESEAYSLNTLLGAAVGLGVGLYAAPRLEVSRRRMLWVDLGAGAGALLPWVVIYPLIQDDAGNADLQATGWISTLGLLGGAYLAWRRTEGMDEEPQRIGRKQIAAVPALLQRWDDGQWSLGMPSLRPAGYRALAPGAGRGVAVDLVGGRF